MFRRPPIFYGWYIVIVAIIGMGLLYGVRNSFSVFFQYIINDFGWNRGSTSIMLSLNILVYGLMAPVSGVLADRWRPRRVIFIGLAIMSLATAACAWAQELWHFYVLFGILSSIGTALCGSPLFYPALANWFTRKRELAIGLAQIGGGLSFAYSIVNEALVSHVGWRYAYLVLAGILLAVLLPLYFFFFHSHPEEKGMTAFGTTGFEKAGEVNPVEKRVTRDWTLGAALRTYQLWLLVLSNFFFWGVGNYLVLAHQIKFTGDVGYSSMFAASVFALFGIAAIAGQVCAPLSRRIGREQTVTLSSALSIGALLALLSVKDTSQPWLLYVYAICSGYASGLFSPTIVVGVADLFYGKSYGAITAMLLTGMGVGGAIGPWLGGYIYDIWYSYDIAFYICIACFALSCICFWIAAPRRAAMMRVKT